MALDKEEQAFLYERCRDALGDRGAKLLMTELPPTGWENLATKHDVEALRLATKQDVEALRLATKQDVEALRLATKQDIALLRTEMAALEHKLLAAFRGELTAAITSQTRSITFQLATMFVGFAGLTWAFR